MNFTHLLLLIPVVLAGQDGPTYATTFKEGTAAKADAMIADCEYDKRGESWGVLHTDIKFSAKLGDFTNGTIITAIDVSNKKTTDQAKIAKTSGGVNSGYVWFHIESTKGHGAKFQFKMWGKVPANQKVKKRTVNCVPGQG